MRLVFNAPVSLSIALVSTLVLVLGDAGILDVTKYFAAPPYLSAEPLDIFTYFSNIFGHANFEHLIGNLTFILLLGPIIEEKYSGLQVLLMTFVTALATSLLNAFFFDTGLMGASGVVFMFILLVSITNVKKGEIPITFILIALLFIGKEVWQALQTDNVSQFAHIIGGICGSIFGFAARK